MSMSDVLSYLDFPDEVLLNIPQNDEFVRYVYRLSDFELPTGKVKIDLQYGDVLIVFSKRKNGTFYCSRFLIEEPML
jgi:hypothetical protein